MVLIRVFRYGLLLVAALLVVLVGTSWGQEGSDSLFEAASGPADGRQIDEGDRLSGRYVTVRIELLRGPAGDRAGQGSALQIELLDGVRHTAHAQSVTSPSPDKVIWQGQIEGQPDSQVTLVAEHGVAAGSIRADGRMYRLTFAGEGRHLLEEMPLAEPMPEHPPIPVILEADEPERGQTATADDGSVIDVLVVYTPQSRIRYGGKAGIEALINLAVAETNTAYEQSLINTRLALVGAVEVSYSESGDMRTDLYRLQGTGDGFLDQVHDWRDTYAADTVTLIQEATDYCGIAFLMTALSHSFGNYAFSVVDSDCATGYYSFGHELGHNMGSTHDRANGGNSLYPYSFGYWASDYSFRTIMAYNCPGGCIRIQRFSNPGVYYNGQPTGIAYNESPSQAADNARSINESKYTVANWRDGSTVLLAAPTSLTAVAQSPTQIALNWQDNAIGETGFELQRRLVGQSWALIADLAANATGYLDGGLSDDTKYEYRIRSYSGNATSSYSNVAGATTPRYPELHVGDLSGGGSIEQGLVEENIIWRANVTIGVHDAYHTPVRSATVSGVWSNGASGSASCVTDITGTCHIMKSGLGTGIASVTFSVTSISNGADPYLPDHNHDPQGNGTTITLNKPVMGLLLPNFQRTP